MSWILESNKGVHSIIESIGGEACKTVSHLPKGTPLREICATWQISQLNPPPSFSRVVAELEVRSPRWPASTAGPLCRPAGGKWFSVYATHWRAPRGLDACREICRLFVLSEEKDFQFEFKMCNIQKRCFAIRDISRFGHGNGYGRPVQLLLREG